MKRLTVVKETELKRLFTAVRDGHYLLHFFTSQSTKRQYRPKFIVRFKTDKAVEKLASQSKHIIQ